ncbi:hypothetical protein [Salinisphaera sp.]|uniref:hypothetical protein n=1 Tax=Salinisphaera sp. TaxID=1914330 RepID=UPI000C55753E|nr:hypothetical protein [Salinisphaera sp.]MAS09791.1 hypothetical protein [Salinisphaera sp.]|tara:strand:- start:64 stop:345 length:282 start_codon:yes stop_codon:yes gene_type:complete
MKRRYAVVAGMAFAIPFGTALSTSQAFAAETAAASWATMDADADGALSPEEVMGTPWEATFDDMDSDGDGKVTKEEFQAYMEDMKASQDSDKE